MPSVDVLVKSDIENSFRVQQVKGIFDVPEMASIEHSWKIDIPLDERSWSIGLIVGPSGSGKSTIARACFGDRLVEHSFNWHEKKAIVDGFAAGLSATEITSALSSVGFSSPPQWLKPYSALSNGQKFRCDLAKALCESSDLVVFDEFTSVVDRTVAKVASAAVSKAIRRQDKKQFVAVSCHSDVEEWLDPDWVLNMTEQRFSWRCLRQRPEIKLTIHKATTMAWAMFSGHHYLTRSIHKAAQCFVACWDGRPVAFTSYLTLVHPKVKNTKREHRTVVLPDFQGVGIGNALSEWLGDYLKNAGFGFQSTTSHPAMIKHRHKSHKWIVARIGHVASPGSTSSKSISKTVSNLRVTANCKYIG